MKEVGENLIEAIKKATAHRGGPAALLRETRPVQLRVLNSDIERLEKWSGKRGLTSVNSCMAALLHEGLDAIDEKEQRRVG
jgi:hypothetical protein